MSVAGDGGTWERVSSGGPARSLRLGLGVALLLEAQEAVAEEFLQQRRREAEVGPLADGKLDGQNQWLAGFGPKCLDQFVQVAPVDVDIGHRDPSPVDAAFGSGFDQPPSSDVALAVDVQGPAIRSDAGKDRLSFGGQGQ